jgi:hypothetical protein
LHLAFALRFAVNLLVRLSFLRLGFHPSFLLRRLLLRRLRFRCWDFSFPFTLLASFSLGFRFRQLERLHPSFRLLLPRFTLLASLQFCIFRRLLSRVGLGASSLLGPGRQLRRGAWLRVHKRHHQSLVKLPAPVLLLCKARSGEH